MLKKISIMIMVSMLLVGTIPSFASGKTDKSGIPTVSLMIICGSVPADANMVAEKLSEVTREKIGCNVEFICTEIGNAATQTNLLLSGGDDSLDIYPAGWMTQAYQTVVNNGQALVLNDLMTPYLGKIKATMGDQVVEAGRINGNLYGLACLLDQASTAVFNLRADIAAQFGYKNGDKVNLDELTELFKKVRAAYPNTPIIGPMNGGPNISDSRVDQLSNNLGVLTNYGQTTTVSDFESPEYMDLTSHIKQWKKMGAYIPDLLNITDAPSDYIPSGKAFGCFASHFSAKLNGIWASQNYGVKMASLQIYDDAVAITPWGYYCINPNSKHPKEAAGFLYLMATDPDVVNLLVNGIKDVHYQILDDGTAAYMNGKNVSSTGWCMGYSWTALNSTLSTPFMYPADYYKQLLAANKNAKRSKAFGCQFDLTSVSDEVSACTNVVNQYQNPIYAGAVDDVDTAVADFQKALKRAGIDKIIAVKQAQLNAYLSAKKE